MTIVIIEDEPLMAAALEREIRQLDPSVKIPVRLATVAEGRAYFQEHPLPDLFFSDIQLTDGLSFQLFEELASTVPVIFCTAFNEYALEAFRQNGIDYLLKPLDPAELARTLARYRNLVQPAVFNPVALATHFTLPTIHGTENLLVNRGERIIPIRIRDVRLFFLRDGIVYAYLTDQERYPIDQTLEELEKSVGPDFYRANRQTLLNRTAIREVKRYFARKLLIRTDLNVLEPIVVSKAKASEFLQWLAN
ncbi:MAG: LytTR family DNA-binding domain-containing protein [Bacteroidota bacterium]